MYTRRMPEQFLFTKEKDSLQRKKAVKTGTASPKEFTDWLYQQSNVIVELTEI